MNYLPPRANRMPGQIVNEAKINKEKKQSEELDFKKSKEQQRQARHDEVKKIIEETKYGGRQMPIAEYNKIKAKVETEEKEK